MSPPPERGGYSARLLQHRRLLQKHDLVGPRIVGGSQVRQGKALSLKKVKKFFQKINDP